MSFKYNLKKKINTKVVSQRCQYLFKYRDYYIMCSVAETLIFFIAYKTCFTFVFWNLNIDEKLQEIINTYRHLYVRG